MVAFPSCGKIRAQEESRRTVKIAVDDFPPFSMVVNGEYRGFDIDLITSICAMNNWEYEMIHCSNVRNIIERVEDGVADIGISGVSIKYDREKRIDYSLPYFESGLQLLVRSDYLATDPYKKIRSIVPMIGRLLFVFFLISTLISFVIWNIEKHNGDEESFSEHFIKGMGQGYYWAVTTLSSTGYGDITPKLPMGRFVAMMVMIFGMIWWGYYTGEIVNVGVKLAQVENNEISIKDFVGKKIATKKYSSSEETLALHHTNVDIVTYPQIDDCVAQLKSGDVDAVMFDSPVLVRYANMDDDLSIIGDKFDIEEYGIVVQNNSELLEEINRALLKLKLEGTYKRIHERWFRRDMM